MKNTFTLFYTLLILILSCCNVRAQRNTVQQQQFMFDSLLTAKVVSQSPGGVALVAREGKIIFQKAYGTADLELGTPMDTRNVFRIGSITKQFTSVAILKLADEGRLSLQDPIRKFITDYPSDSVDITIAHLLTHTSGIKNITGLKAWTPELMRSDLSVKEVIDLFKKEPLDFEPGTQFRYSNSNYILLGQIIEIVTGINYATYLRQNFFSPNKMSRTHYDSAWMIIPGRLTGYQRRGNAYEHAQPINMSLPFGAGGLLSTAEDLFAWNEALSQGVGLKPETLRMAHTSYQLKNGKLTGYGYGWETGNVQGSRSIKHAGRINGFVTFVLAIPEEKIFVTILTNCGCVDDLETTASMMAAIAMDKPYKHRVVRLSSKEMASYQGIYQTEEGSQKTVSYEDGRLLLFDKGGLKQEILPYGKDRFFMKDALTTFQFERDDKGTIHDLKVNGTGMPATWMRTGEEVEHFKMMSVKPAALAKYAGNYQFSPGPLFTVTVEGSRIFGAVGSDKKELRCYDHHRFVARDLDARIVFDVDNRGEVTGLRKIQSDEMKAMKVR